MLAHKMTKIEELSAFFKALDEMSLLDVIAGKTHQILQIIERPSDYRGEVELCKTYDFIKQGSSIRPEFVEHCVEDIAEAILELSAGDICGPSLTLGADDLWTKWEKEGRYLSVCNYCIFLD